MQKPETLIVEPVEPETAAVVLVPVAMTVGELRRALLRYRDETELAVRLDLGGCAYDPVTYRVRKVTVETTIRPNYSHAVAPLIVVMPWNAFEVPNTTVEKL